VKDFSFSCRRLLPQNIERIREPLNYVDIIEKNIYNIDSKICGIIDDYKVLRDSQKVADYVIQFLRTYLETIAARIYAYENPDKPTPIRGKDKWYTQYIKALKETNEYGYIWMFHHSLQIVTSHYVPAEDGAVRFMEGHINLLYQLRNHMREMFGLNLMENLEDYPQERNEELNPYYRKIYNSLREIQVEESAEHTKDRYYIMRKKYRFVDGRGFFEYTLAYAQEEITKFDRFVVYSFSDIPDNYSIQCDFAHTSVDFNGIDIDIKCLVAWTVSIRPCELEKIAAIAGYEVTVRSYNTFYRAMMKFLSKKGMNLLDILLADENDYDIYSEQVQIGQTSKFAEVFNKLRDIIINDKSGCNIIRYLISFLRNDVIRDQLADCPNNRLSYLYLKNEAIPFDEMPYASSLYKHNVTTSRLHRCLDIDDCEHQYLSAIVNSEAYDSNTLYVAIDEKSLDYYLYEKDIFNKSLYKSEKQQLRRIESFFNYLYVKNYFELTKAIIGKLQQYTSEGVRDYLQTINGKKEVIEKIDDNEKKKIVSNIFKHSRLGMIYGAAGTGKTKVAEHIAKIFDDKNILLLANTNAAKNNLQDRINNAFCDCYTVHDYIKNKNSNKIYDLVIVDECSTVCNEDILQLFEKCNSEAYLLLGDIHQIEAIKFGNWFNFARYFIEKNSVYELSIPYRAKNNNTLLDMWSYVRHYDENMFERLQANGYISTLDESIFEKTEDEIILCLGYDGLYGVNNINRYMQKVNPSNPVEWGNWVYKVGDKVLFNDNKRFGSVLYNNLKGTIVTIDRKDEEIVFQIQIDKKISDRDIFYTDLKLHDCACEGKSIVEFSVKKRIEKDSDTDYSEQVVPFQIAYAVSIHKAQGLEYKSVKVVITEDVDEQISHNIFYTAITRTTDKLKIYLSKETQKKLATKFVESNVGLKQAQIFAQHAGLKLKNKLSS
jgi:hypothetical protein